MYTMSPEVLNLAFTRGNLVLTVAVPRAISWMTTHLLMHPTPFSALLYTTHCEFCSCQRFYLNGALSPQ